MKFYASIAAGVCTIWLVVEPDPDQSSDPRIGFTPDFPISAGYLKKLWTDSIRPKFYWSIAAGSWTNWLRLELDPYHNMDKGTGFTPDF